MQRLLEQNAKDIHSDLSKREASRKKIDKAVYLERTLYSKEEFLRLVWMYAPGILGSELYNQLTPDEEPRTLQNLVKKITDHYQYESPHQIFMALNSKLSRVRQVEQYDSGSNASENNRWFEGCITVNGTFDPRLVRELWVRDLLKHERKQSPYGMYYIEDGCHRALVYAINLEFKVVDYIPIKVRWCKSWRHILPWAAEPDTSHDDN